MLKQYINKLVDERLIYNKCETVLRLLERTCSGSFEYEIDKNYVVFYHKEITDNKTIFTHSQNFDKFELLYNDLDNNKWTALLKKQLVGKESDK